MRALQQAGGKVSGLGGAAELLGMRPTPVLAVEGYGYYRQFGSPSP